MSGFWLPPPWQAAAGFGVPIFQVVVKADNLISAVAQAPPQSDLGRRPAILCNHNKPPMTLAFQINSWSWHAVNLIQPAHLSK